MMTVFRRALLLSVMLPTPALAQQAFQDIPALETRVVAVLGADIGTTGGPAAPLDRRLKLAVCPVPVQIDPPVGGAIALRCPQIGWRIRVALAGVRNVVAQPAEAALPPAAPVIRRGDPVELIASAAGFSVSTQAVAEQDGAPGDRIRVRTDRLRPPLIGEVIAEGEVRVPGFK